MQAWVSGENVAWCTEAAREYRKTFLSDLSGMFTCMSRLRYVGSNDVDLAPLQQKTEASLQVSSITSECICHVDPRSEIVSHHAVLSHCVSTLFYEQEDTYRDTQV